MIDLSKKKSGQKMRMALGGVNQQGTKFDMVCTFHKALDSASFLASVPMLEGQALPLDETQKLLFHFDNDAQTEIIVGYADFVVQEGIRRYWKIRKVEERQFFQRVDERLKVSLPVLYKRQLWQSNESSNYESSISLDISNGGIALYMSRPMDVGDLCQIMLPKIDSSADGKSIENLLGAACWSREAPKGSPYRFLCGLQFRFADPTEKETVARYIASVKKYAL